MQQQQPQPQRPVKYATGAANTRVPPAGAATGSAQPGAANAVPGGQPFTNGTATKPAGKRFTIDSQYLATCSSQQQKQTLGEYLYPIIAEMQGMELAGRITGMLLELDNSDLMDMLQAHDEGGEELKKKVDEAVAVIKAHAAKEAVHSVTRNAIEN